MLGSRENSPDLVAGQDTYLSSLVSSRHACFTGKLQAITSLLLPVLHFLFTDGHPVISGLVYNSRQSCVATGKSYRQSWMGSKLAVSCSSSSSSGGQNGPGPCMYLLPTWPMLSSPCCWTCCPYTLPQMMSAPSQTCCCLPSLRGGQNGRP